MTEKHFNCRHNSTTGTLLLFSAAAAYVRIWMLYSATQNHNERTNPWPNADNFYFGAYVGYTLLATSFLATAAEVWDHSRPLESNHSHQQPALNNDSNESLRQPYKKIALKIVLSTLAMGTIGAQIYADYCQFSSLRSPALITAFTAFDSLYLTVVSGRHMYLHIFDSITNFMQSMTNSNTITDTAHWKTIAAINLVVHIPGALLQANRITNPFFRWACAVAITVPEVIEHSDEWLTKGNIHAYLPPYKTCTKAFRCLIALLPWAGLNGLSMCAQNVYFLSSLSQPNEDQTTNGWPALALAFTTICVLIEFANGYISATNHAIGRWIGDIKQKHTVLESNVDDTETLEGNNYKLLENGQSPQI